MKNKYIVYVQYIGGGSEYVSVLARSESEALHFVHLRVKGVYQAGIDYNHSFQGVRSI